MKVEIVNELGEQAVAAVLFSFGQNLCIFGIWCKRSLHLIYLKR